MKTLCIIPCRSVQWGEGRLPTLNQLVMGKLAAPSYPAKFEVCLFLCFALDEGEPMGPREVDVFVQFGGKKALITKATISFEMKRMDAVAIKCPLNISAPGKFYICVSEMDDQQVEPWPLEAVQGVSGVDWSPSEP